MRQRPGTLHFGRSPHLVELIGEAERLAAGLTLAPVPPAAREHALQQAALATLRLDGSTIVAPPDVDAAVGDTAAGPVAGGSRPGTWLDTLRTRSTRLEDSSDERIWALEYRGAQAGLEAHDLAQPLLTAPLDALAELHRRMVRGLLDEDHAGRPRQTEQAVHDASVGRIVFFPSDPGAIASELALVDGWLTSTGAREHTLVVAGVLHLELLRIHPFEAANGRLARAAARLVLHAGGLDPHHLAAFEPVLERDPIGYYQEVARTLRRRDLTIWLERFGEAVTAGLRDAGRRLELAVADPSPRARAFVAGRCDPAFTIADYRAEVQVGSQDAAADLGALLDAGLVVRVPGSRGLRFTVATGAGG